MIDQNQLIQHDHPSEVRHFQALSHDKLYLDRFNKRKQYSDNLRFSVYLFLSLLCIIKKKKNLSGQVASKTITRTILS